MSAATEQVASATTAMRPQEPPDAALWTSGHRTVSMPKVAKQATISNQATVPGTTTAISLTAR
jgi:hypothetical protein